MARKLEPTECSDEVALAVCQAIYDLHGYDWACVAAEAYSVPQHWFLE